MCFSIAFIDTTPKKYVEQYLTRLPQNIFNSIPQEFPNYYYVSGFVHPVLPIITESSVVFSQWGLIPSWVTSIEKAEKIKNATLNAASETIFEKPSFKKNIYRQRAILGISGFFEWHKLNKNKIPYFIYHKERILLSLGCIYDVWHDKANNQFIHSFSIITTPANKLLENIHNTKKRMPLIIPEKDLKTWLFSDDINQIKKIITPLEEPILDAYPINPTVNKVKVETTNSNILNPFPVNYMIPWE
jgi:putative SOS response-associated peptidase YedK